MFTWVTAHHFIYLETVWATLQKNKYSHNIINITAPPSPTSPSLLLRDDLGGGQRSLQSTHILSVFLTVSMFPSVCQWNGSPSVTDWRTFRRYWRTAHHGRFWWPPKIAKVGAYSVSSPLEILLERAAECVWKNKHRWHELHHPQGRASCGVFSFKILCYFNGTNNTYTCFISLMFSSNTSIVVLCRLVFL